MPRHWQGTLPACDPSAPVRAWPLGARRAALEIGFVAIEPYAAITDAMNQAHKGAYKELQSIAPGGRWEESFWISASGY